MNSQIGDFNLTEEEINDLLNKDIIDLLGLQDASEAEKNEIRQKMIDTIENRVYTIVYDELQAQGHWPEYETERDETKKEQILADADLNMEKLFIQQSLLYKIEMVEARKLANIGFTPSAGN